jgi:hypothetical protein
MSSAVIVNRLAPIALSGALVMASTSWARAGEPSDAPEQAGAAKTPAAEELFQEGRRLFDERKLDQACGKLAESHRLEPAVNTIGLLAACYEEQGRLGAAARGYREAEELAGAGDRRAGFARKKLNELRAKIGALTVRLAQPEDGASIAINNEPVAAADLEREIFVDPGAVRVEARAPGREEWRATLEMGPGEVRTIEIPALALTASGAPPATSDPGGPSALRVVGFVTGGLGLVGLGVGAGFGFAAISKTNASNIPGRCDEQNRCSKEGGAIRDEARSLALVSTVSFGAGVALAGAGLALVLVTAGESSEEEAAFIKRPSRSARGRGASIAAAPIVGPGALGVSLAGTFTAF